MKRSLLAPAPAPAPAALAPLTEAEILAVTGGAPTFEGFDYHGQGRTVLAVLEVAPAIELRLQLPRIR